MLRIARNHAWLPLLLAASLILLNAGGARATPPLTGNTLDFGAGGDVGTSASDQLSVAAGDLDNDGDLDLVTGNTGGQITAFENGGSPFSGAWASVVIGAAPTPMSAVALGDLDSDGYLDIVAGGEVVAGYEISVWQNSHSPFAGTWTTTHVVGNLTDSVTSVDLGDWDHDGDPDIVSGDLNGDVRVWENTATRFTADWTSSLAGTADDGVRSLAVGDLDHDGRLDVVSGGDTVVGNYTLNAWLNADDSPFSGAWTQVDVGDTATRLNSVALADADADGDFDIVSGRQSGAITLWQNPYTFGVALPNDWVSHGVGASSAAVSSVRAGDLDGDGDTDIVSTSASAEDFEVIAWQNDDPFGATWTQTDIGASGDHVFAARLADLDGDGDLDLATGAGATATTEVVAWPNTHAHRNAVFTNGGLDAGTIGLNPFMEMAAGDLDHDGDPDIVSAALTGANELSVWENDGSPFSGDLWTQHAIGTSGSGSIEVMAMGDLDNDGDLDLAIGTTSFDDFEVSVWQNDGTPFDGAWFQQDVGSPNDSTVIALALGDLNNDGFLDIVTSNAYNAIELTAWENNQDPFGGAWSSSDLGDTFQNIYGLALGDLDNDGDLDVVSGTHNPYNTVTAWGNDGAPFGGVWSTSGDIGVASVSIRTITLGHLDDDGFLDVVSGSDPGTGEDLIAWGSDGTPFDGGWAQGDIGESEAGITDAVLGDLDADGDLDIVTGEFSNSSEEVVAWLNDGTPYDEGWARRGVGQTTSVGGVTVSDLDGDGDLDIVSGSNQLEDYGFIVWQNTGGSAGLAATGAAPAEAGAAIEFPLQRVDFAHNGIAGDGDLELHTLNVSLARSDCSTPLTTLEAANLIANLRVRLDDGDGEFEIGDTLVADITSLSLTGGVQEIAFSDGDANVQIGAGETATYWISITSAADAPSQDPPSLCLLFDPDADALVQAKGSDYSVSQEDTGLVSSGAVAFVHVTFMPIAVSD